MGGGNPYAKMDSIIIIRNSPGGQRVLNFHYGQVAAGKSLEHRLFNWRAEMSSSVP